MVGLEFSETGSQRTGTLYVSLDDLERFSSPASTSQGLGLQACVNKPGSQVKNGVASKRQVGNCKDKNTDYHIIKAYLKGVCGVFFPHRPFTAIF